MEALGVAYSVTDRIAQKSYRQDPIVNLTVVDWLLMAV
jgi:hypothetical protein